MIGLQNFENIFKNQKDPWHISIRASQHYRFERYLFLLQEYAPLSSIFLDTGCAAGDFTVMLTQLPHTQKVIGIDYAQEAIYKAQLRYSQTKKNVTFQCAQIQNLRFTNNMFDVVTYLETFYYLSLEEQWKSIRECTRIIKQDGIFLFSSNIDFGYPTEKIIKKMICDSFIILISEYHYNLTYRSIEKWFILIVEKIEPFAYLKTIHDIHHWKENQKIESFIGKCILFLLVVLRYIPGMIFIFRTISSVAKKILSNKKLFKMIQKISSLYAKPDQIIIVAQKK